MAEFFEMEELNEAPWQIGKKLGCRVVSEDQPFLTLYVEANAKRIERGISWDAVSKESGVCMGALRVGSNPSLRDVAGLIAWLEDRSAPVDLSQRGSLERALIGGLKTQIAAHGPITKEWLSSTTKRLLGAIKTWNTDGARPVTESDGEGDSEESAVTLISFIGWRPGFTAIPLTKLLRQETIGGLGLAVAKRLVDALLYDGKSFSVEVHRWGPFKDIKGIVFEVDGEEIEGGKATRSVSS